MRLLERRVGQIFRCHLTERVEHRGGAKPCIVASTPREVVGADDVSPAQQQPQRLLHLLRPLRRLERELGGGSQRHGKLHVIAPRRQEHVLHLLDQVEHLARIGGGRKIGPECCDHRPTCEAILVIAESLRVPSQRRARTADGGVELCRGRITTLRGFAGASLGPARAARLGRSRLSGPAAAASTSPAAPATWPPRGFTVTHATANTPCAADAHRPRDASHAHHISCQAAITTGVPVPMRPRSRASVSSDTRRQPALTAEPIDPGSFVPWIAI